jgi:hypothetical protein
MQPEIIHEEEFTSRSFKSSAKRPPSASTSKRSVLRKTNMTFLNKDLETKSKIDLAS